MAFKKALGFGLWTMAMLAGCGGGGGGSTPAQPTLQSITVALASNSLQVGATTNASAVASYSDGSTSNVTSTVVWGSDTAAATVNAAGLVTAATAGTAVISARLGTTAGGTTITVTAVPVPTVQSITVTLGAQTLALGQNTTATAMASYSNGSTANITNTATWASSTGAATVSNTGAVTSAAAGTTNITATLSGVTGSAALTVTAPTITSIAVTPATGTVATGGAPLQLTATATFSNSTTANVSSSAAWSTPQTACASTVAGLVTSILGAGNDCVANISATQSGVSGAAQITTQPEFLSGVALPIGVFRPTAVAVGDLNADGLPDSVIAAEIGVLVVTLGTGGGAYFSSDETNVVVNHSRTLPRLARINADAHLDIVVSNGSEVIVLFGDGTGAFPTRANIPFASSAPGPVAVGDFNGDTFLDLAVASASGNAVVVRTGNGNGTFNATTSFAAGTAPQSVDLADMNGDGNVDLVVRQTAGVGVMRGNGLGLFSAPLEVAQATAPRSLAVADLDADNRPDVAVANNNAAIVLLKNDGTGQLAAQAPVASEQSTVDGVAVGDINGDGRPDLVASGNLDNLSTGITLLYGTGPMTYGVPAHFAVSGGTSDLYPSTLVDVTGDGKLDLLSPDAGNVGPVRLFINR